MNDDQDPSEAALEARLVELRQDHADLDAAVQAIALSPLPDMLLIGRLKRKKLTPDIIA
jgi:hypothetical protein